MTKLQTKLNKIKNSNLVFLVEKIADLKEIADLKLEEKIVNKIKEIIKK